MFSEIFVLVIWCVYDVFIIVVFVVVCGFMFVIVVDVVIEIFARVAIGDGDYVSTFLVCFEL